MICEMYLRLFSLSILFMSSSGFVRLTSNMLWGQSQSPSRSLLEIKQSTSSSERNERWDALRFVAQSSKFVSLFPKQNNQAIVVQPGDILWKPTSYGNENDNSNILSGFSPLDDVVMGGASSSTFDVVTGKWTGKVTDANNGGFVGIRSTPPSLLLDMSKCRGIEVSVYSFKLRKKLVKVAIRDSSDFNGISWSTGVNTKSANGQFIRVPFSKLVPTRFAKTIEGETFQRNSLTGFQFVYSKFEYDGKLNPTFSVGDVDMQIDEIRAY